MIDIQTEELAVYTRGHIEREDQSGDPQIRRWQGLAYSDDGMVDVRGYQYLAEPRWWKDSGDFHGRLRMGWDAQEWHFWTVIDGRWHTMTQYRSRRDHITGPGAMRIARRWLKELIDERD